MHNAGYYAFCSLIICTLATLVGVFGYVIGYTVWSFAGIFI
jgi:hypothetical protein